MFDISSILKLLPVVGPVVAAAPEFKKIYDQIVATFDDDADQDQLKEAYKDIIADNDAGHKRLQDKLAAAAKQ